MLNLSEKIADSYRNKKASKANPANRITNKRRKLFEHIKERAGGNPESELLYSMQMIKKNRPKIDAYILSRNETPLDSAEDAALQAYQLRCNEIEEAASILGVSEGEAGIFIEDDEAETAAANNYEGESSLGELFAPIGIAAKHLANPDADNFLDAGLVTGIANTIGEKIDIGALKRAAQNKPSGIIGFLSGGNKEYDAVRAYLQRPENIAEKNAVIAGTITSASQLKGFGGLPANSTGVKVLAKDVIDEITRQKKREAINKALPFIIIGIAAIILITVLIVKRAKNK